MKITANRKEDILRRKAEYEADYNVRKERHNAQYADYTKAVRSVEQSVRQLVLEEIGDTSIELTVTARETIMEMYEVRVTSYENQVHDPDKALSWSWEVKLSEDGEVLKDSSSWTNLRATTLDHIASLKEAVRVLEILNTIDWSTILSEATAAYPKYNEYVTESDPKYDRNKPNFDKELLEAEIEDIIGTDTLIKGKGNAYRTDSWYLILRATPKQYKVAEIGGYALEPDWLESNHKTVSEVVDQNKNYAVNITKEKFHNMIIQPIEVMEV